MIRLWRLLRTASGIYFLIAGIWFRGAFPTEPKYAVAFVLMGAYLLFLDAFALYVVAARRLPLGDFLVRRYGFWQGTQEEFRVACAEATDSSPVWFRCSGYESWAPQRMRKEKCSSVWTIRVPVEVGEHEYVFESGGRYFTDPAANKSRHSPLGSYNSVREVGYLEFPGARVQITNISTQVLIAIGVGILAFGGQAGPGPSFYGASISVLAGLVYNFIFGGSIVRERHNGEPHIVTVVALHQEVMEILLNVQVLALIFALTAATVK